jgi:hypothetical protein
MVRALECPSALCIFARAPCSNERLVTILLPQNRIENAAAADATRACGRAKSLLLHRRNLVDDFGQAFLDFLHVGMQLSEDFVFFF